MNTMKPDISLSEQIPVTEPERQYYYIEKAKEYLYCPRKCKYESLWASGTVKPCQEKTSTYDDRSLRLYDAGTGSCREVKKELSVCGSDFWNP